MKLDDIDYSNNTTAGAAVLLQIKKEWEDRGSWLPNICPPQDGQFANVISVILGQLSKG